jgi:hypothetical protein
LLPIFGIPAHATLTPRMIPSRAAPAPPIEPRLQQQHGWGAGAVAVFVAIVSTLTPAFADIVISELMYHPTGTPEPLGEEFIELTNTGDEAVDISGWKINRGINFTIPNATVVTPGGYLVLAANRAALLARTPGALNIVEGGWNGRLSNSGENVRLVNVADETIDQVDYTSEGDWAARRIGPVLSGTRGWIWSAPHDGAGMSRDFRRLPWNGKLDRQ